MSLVRTPILVVPWRRAARRWRHGIGIRRRYEVPRARAVATSQGCRGLPASHDQSGTPVSARGRAWARRGDRRLPLHRCPDVCPVIAGNLNTALKARRPRRRPGCSVLAVSVDPSAIRRGGRRTCATKAPAVVPLSERRTPQELQQRVEGVQHRRHASPGQGTVPHSTVELLIDPRGREVLSYGSDVQAADVGRPRPDDCSRRADLAPAPRAVRRGRIPSCRSGRAAGRFSRADP